MTKTVNDDVLDAALDEIRDNCNLMTLCSQAPTTRTEAVTTYALADVSMSSGDFTKANGDTSGRKLTVSAKNTVPVDTDGTGTHLALVDGTRLLYVTSCASTAVVDTGDCDIPAWDIELRDPT